MQPIVARSAIPAILPNPASSARADNAAQPQVTPGTIPTGVPGADKAAAAASTPDRHPPVFPAALSADSLDALQSVEHGKSANSPAQLARAAIAADPSLGDGPFGHIVSQIARGETPVAGSAGDVTDTPTDSNSAGDVTSPGDGSETPPTDVADLPPSDTSTDVPPSDTTDIPSETASDVPTTGTPTDTSSDTASDPTPNVAGTDPDQALIDALA